MYLVGRSRTLGLRLLEHVSVFINDVFNRFLIDCRFQGRVRGQN